MVQEEYRFDNHDDHHKPSKVDQFLRFIWNSKTKSFCGRDGESWGKLALFYSIFYLCLGSFFIGLLAIFVNFMPRNVPSYYGEASTMNARGLNPGLGFRPQIDVEDAIIHYNPNIVESPQHGYLQQVTNIKHFLSSKYRVLNAEEKSNVQTCADGSDQTTDLRNNKACEFDYNKIFKDTSCTDQNNFGYKTNKPCVLIKLNKIIDWVPKLGNSTAIKIKCEGEGSMDKDNLKKVLYHSEGHLNNAEGGFLDKKYFPYFNQKGYRAPFIWAEFEVTPNTLVNIECKAYADNIDNKDRLNRRGQTKFSLFVSNPRK